ncbi:DUF305 domain-containing protein [Paenibacillus sp. TRM 82003]|uniref:DUF305 domain-containing protein n=1 Tax=Kineococcus sp. TRM81007 TaxID=2925831 RepID=UPI001F59B477|nr:DUF305 domain-containing protein [Kineococcus sp. TRM81007]MCI2239158.1 DUF305 domain-containing protein [Kineococcus sp. TRM81007]MCI3924837.1 DUF305 domain-containing protein [Paenibacillus sp. TRM 82003]
MSPRDSRPRAGRVLLVAAAVLVALVGGVLAGRALPDAPGERSAAVGFARDMTTHHQQAIAMAFEAVQEAPSAEVRQLAVDIASTQGNQVGRMQALLREWGHPLTGSAPAMAWMSTSQGHAGHAELAQQEGRAMPGMATAEEMARLSELTGEEFEVFFLQLMLRHHAGGLQMAESGAELVGDEQLRELAAAILASQSSETQVLTDLLAERGAQPLPFPADEAAGA